MATRKTVTASVIDGAGLTVDSRTKYAWNSGVRETEAILRDYGRENGVVLEGAKPEVVRDDTGREYRREWTASNGATFWALVKEES